MSTLSGLQPFSGSNLTAMKDSDVGHVWQMHGDTYGLQEEGEFIDQGEKELPRHIMAIAYISLVRYFASVDLNIKQASGFRYYQLLVYLARYFQCTDPRHTKHDLITARKT